MASARRKARLPRTMRETPWWLGVGSARWRGRLPGGIREKPGGNRGQGSGYRGRGRETLLCGPVAFEPWPDQCSHAIVSVRDTVLVEWLCVRVSIRSLYVPGDADTENHAYREETRAVPAWITPEMLSRLQGDQDGTWYHTIKGSHFSIPVEFSQEFSFLLKRQICSVDSPIKTRRKATIARINDILRTPRHLDSAKLVVTL